MSNDRPAPTLAAATEGDGDTHREQLVPSTDPVDGGTNVSSEAAQAEEIVANGEQQQFTEARDGIDGATMQGGKATPDEIRKASGHGTAATAANGTDNSPRQQKRRKQQASSTPRPNVTRQDTEGTDDTPDQHHAESIQASRFTLWETKTRFFLVSYNTAQTRFRILKVDRTPEGHHQQQHYQQQQQEQEQQKQRQAASSADSTSGKDDRDHRSTPESMRNMAKETNGNASMLGAKSTLGETASTKSAQNQPPRPPPPTSADFWGLNVTADQAVYDRNQITELLDMISEGNRTTGGLKEVGHFFGLIGFIRFTSTYYMVLISRRSVVALLGGHYIYHCDETKILPICHPAFMASLSGRTKLLEHEEARLLHTFKQVDLGKNFYFSYTYDLTRTLQENLTGCGRGQSHPQRPADAKHTAWGYCEKFIWNHHLLLPAFRDCEHTNADSPDQGHSRDWILPLCYGFVDQAKLSVMSRTVHVTLIARRSRHFAGARFLKRGADEGGHVANDVETEQIVSEGLTTSFYSPADSEDDQTSPRVSQNPRFTAYVMHRGSIPIFWTQDSTNMSPRPPIEISVVDPYFSAAAIHFDDMLARYGSPVIILNLIKSQEKTPRESKLLNAFTECVHYLNQFLPLDKKMVYVAWDMSQASKSREQDVIETLEEMAAEILEQTRFFHSGPEPTRFEFDYRKDGVDVQEGPAGQPARREDILLQTGVARINCVDCLDRTNAAQFVVGKAAFGHQLHAMGLIDAPYVGFDSDATDMLTEMYHDLGDTIALQYGGSHLVNTMETYRKINQWTSHSRDMLEGLKRYYANSFVDADKQAAINLFLGITRDAAESASTALSTNTARSRRRSYRNWYTADHLEEIGPTQERKERLQRVIAEQSTFFWAEYYRPRLFTDLMRHHAFKMTAVHQHQPVGLIPNGGHAAGGSSGSVHFPTPGASGIVSGWQGPLPSSPSKKSITHQQTERLRRESISSLAAPSSPSSPTLGRLAMGAAGGVSGFSRARTTSFGSSSNAVPQHAGSGGGSTVAVSGPQGTYHARPIDAAVLVTSPFTSRVTGRRDSGSSDSRMRQAQHRRRQSNGSEVGSAISGSSKFQPRLRTISGSSTLSIATTAATATTGTTGSGGLQLRSTVGPPPSYTVDEYGTHVHESTKAALGVPSSRADSGSAPDVNTHGNGNAQDSRALMGGVRRWMTLNHGGEGRRVVSVSGESSSGAANGQRVPSSAKSNWLGKRQASISVPVSVTEGGSDGKTAPSDWTGGGGAPAPPSNAIGGWNNPFPVQSATTGQQGAMQQSQRVTAESLLSDWSNPSVDASEAQEYASWVSQFAGNIRLESSLPEYDALLAASAGVGSGDDADQIVLDSTHSLSPADLKLYIQSVKRATRCQMSAGAMSGDGASQTAPTATVDPVAALYTNLSASYAYQPGTKGVSEVKLRAFRNWLNIGLAGR